MLLFCACTRLCFYSCCYLYCVCIIEQIRPLIDWLIEVDWEKNFRQWQVDFAVQFFQLFCNDISDIDLLQTIDAISLVAALLADHPIREGSADQSIKKPIRLSRIFDSLDLTAFICLMMRHALEVSLYLLLSVAANCHCGFDM